MALISHEFSTFLIVLSTFLVIYQPAASMTLGAFSETAAPVHRMKVDFASGLRI